MKSREKIRYFDKKNDKHPKQKDSSLLRLLSIDYAVLSNGNREMRRIAKRIKK